MSGQFPFTSLDETCSYWPTLCLLACFGFGFALSLGDLNLHLNVVLSPTFCLPVGSPLFSATEVGSPVAVLRWLASDAMNVHVGPAVCSALGTPGTLLSRSRPGGEGLCSVPRAPL